MKKFPSVIAILALVFSPLTPAFADAVVASRDTTATDLTGGAVFDNLGAHVLTAQDPGNNIFTTGDVTTSGNGGANAGTLTFAGNGTAQNVGAVANALLAVNAGADTKTVSFAEDVYATTFTVTGEGTVNMNGSLTGDLTFGAGANTTGNLVLATGEAITGDVTANTANEGVLEFAGVAAMTGNIGAIGPGNELHLVTINAGAVTASGNVAATTINFAGDGSLQIANTKTLEGAVTTAITNTGTLTFTENGTMTGQVGTALNLLKEVNAGADGATVDFDAVYATALNVTGTGQVNLDGASTITTTTIDTTGTLDLADTLTGNIVYDGAGVVTINGGDNIAGSITTDADNQGTLTIETGGNTVVTGSIGTSAALDLGTINVQSAVGETATFTGAVYANALTTSDAGTTVISTDSTIGTLTLGTAAGILDLDGSLTGNLDFDFAGTTATVITGENISGTVDNTTGGDGVGTITYEGASTIGGVLGSTNTLFDVNINGGVVTSSSNISATTIDIANNGTFRLDANLTTTGTLATAAAANADIDLQGYTLTHVGDLTFGADSDLNFDITDATTFGTATVSGTLTLPADVDITANVIGNNYIAGGTQMLVIDGTAGAGVAGGNTVTDNSYVLSFTAGTDANNRDLILTATRSNPYNTVTTNSNTSAVGTALENAGKTNANSDMGMILNTLDSMSSAKEIEKAMETMEPDVSRATIDGVNNALNQFLGTVNSRLSSARSDFAAGQTGVATGDALKGLSIWAQGFGNHIDQDKRKGIDGYRANTFGTALGVDKLIGEDFILGFGQGFAWTDINSKGDGNTETNITSYQSTLYGSYNPENWYIDGFFAFAHNEYDSNRHIQFANIDRHAEGDYSGQQYSWKFEGGYEVDVEGIKITPIASLQYTFLQLHDYTETGAGALNLDVDSKGYHTLMQGLGLETGYPFEWKNLMIDPSIRAMWYYDYIGDKAETTASFTGGGTSFNTNGAKPAQHSMLWGAEVVIMTKNNVSVSVNYDLEMKDEFISNSYYGTVRYEF